MLTHACGNGHLHVARILLAYDADINHRVYNSRDVDGENNGLSALDWACLRFESTAEDEELWEYLVSKGAHLQAQCQPSLNAAAPTMRHQTNLLHRAASSGHLAVLKFGREHGLYINQKSNEGETPLIIGIRDKVDMGVIQFLVDNDADVHEGDSKGNSVLHLATLGRVEMAELALDQGIDVNVRNSILETPLAFLSRYERDDLSMANFLVQRGADLTTKNSAGHNLLHSAVKNKSSIFVNFALENLIKVSELTAESQSALDYAYLYEVDESIFKLLRDALREELPRCSSCLEDAAHIQFKPCRHQYACIGCCINWKVCKCGKVIEKKVDVLFDRYMEASKEMAPDPHAQVIEMLRKNKRELRNERDNMSANMFREAQKHSKDQSDLEQKHLKDMSDLKQKYLNYMSELKLKHKETLDLAKKNEAAKLKDLKSCPICMERQINRVFNCGHTCCEHCASRMIACHTCRRVIEGKHKLFL